MPTYKLTYFPARGRAEVIRLIFAQSGVEYEDVRIPFNEWGGLKPNTPWGGIPILEVDGKIIGQSIAIARYVAKQHGLAGKDPFESALMDSVVDAALDITAAGISAHYEKDEDRKAVLEKKFKKEVIPKSCGNLEKFLTKNNSGDGFFVGDSVSWADLFVFTVIEGGFDGGYLEQLGKLGYQKLVAHYHRVAALPNIKAWLDTRPKTNF